MTNKLALYVSEGPDLVHYSLNADDASITRRSKVSVPQEVQYAWVHPTNRYLYVASSNGIRGSEHHLAAFAIASDGTLSQIAEPLRLVNRPIHLSVDGSGQYLLTAYNVPSAATVHLIGPDGRIGREIDQPSDLGTGYYPHQIRVLPSNKSAVVVARGTHRPGERPDPGSLEICQFTGGVLRNAQSIAPHHEYGPRHLDFHPTKPWVYASLEHQNEIHMYEMRDDRLSPEPLFTHSLLAEPDNVRPRQMGGTIHVHPNGRYVYVANRADHTVQHVGGKIFGGGENWLAVFEIDQTTGEPRRIQLADPLGFYIRCFDLDPRGRLLVTASLIDMNVLEGSEIRHVPRAIALFNVGEDGRLTPASRYEIDTNGRKQWWMKIIPLPGN